MRHSFSLLNDKEKFRSISRDALEFSIVVVSISYRNLFSTKKKAFIAHLKLKCGPIKIDKLFFDIVLLNINTKFSLGVHPIADATC